jgi:DNA invertase Pin-like site-specific DNA recombinase
LRLWSSATHIRICLYTRISTDEENQPTSLASQHERLEAFCKVQEDWRIVARHDDRSTGTKLDRPGLQAALDLARQKYGPKACQGERVPREKLETAVLHQLTGIYRNGPLIHDALAAAQQQTQLERPALDERRHAIVTEIASIERSTERYFEAFERKAGSPPSAANSASRA